MLGRLGGEDDPCDTAVVHEYRKMLWSRPGIAEGPRANANEARSPRRRAETQGGLGSLRPGKGRPFRGRLEARPAGDEHPGGRPLFELGALGTGPRRRGVPAPGPEEGRQEEPGGGPAAEAQGALLAPPSSRVSPYRAARARASATSSGSGRRSSGGWSRAR